VPQDPEPTKEDDVIKGDTYYPLRWFFRPETVQLTVQPRPLVVVQLKDDLAEYPFEQLPSVLSEIDIRHWRAVRQILIEAKLKAEVQLRNDAVIKDAQLSAYYQGWVNHADYVLANFEGLRAGEMPMSGAGHQHLSHDFR